MLVLDITCQLPIGEYRRLGPPPPHSLVSIQRSKLASNGVTRWRGKRGDPPLITLETGFSVQGLEDTAGYAFHNYRSFYSPLLTPPLPRPQFRTYTTRIPPWSNRVCLAATFSPILRSLLGTLLEGERRGENKEIRIRRRCLSHATPPPFLLPPQQSNDSACILLSNFLDCLINQSNENNERVCRSNFNIFRKFCPQIIFSE